MEAAAGLTGVPVLRVDQPMADKAVQTGKRIGVVATLSTTLQPTSDLVKRRAAVAGKTIELETVLCEGAFDALMSGDTATHDAMVAKALRELSAKTDVIVLAQASHGPCCQMAWRRKIKKFLSWPVRVLLYSILLLFFQKIKEQLTQFLTISYRLQVQVTRTAILSGSQAIVFCFPCNLKLVTCNSILPYD